MIKKTLIRAWHDVWYKDPFIGAALAPFGFLFYDFARFRRWLYRISVKKTHAVEALTVIVGNITVGGTGKTPLCLYLADLLLKNDYRVGMVSRGYGGHKTLPQQVLADGDASQVGDEALLIAERQICPLVCAPNRVEAARYLLSLQTCDVILCDDGLQHYALERGIEIAVIDGERRFGNGHYLPAGPLREAIERLNEVDMVVVNGKAMTDTVWTEWEMQLHGDKAINLITQETKPLSYFHTQECHAIAGIGHPQRFFNQLANAGIEKRIDHSYPDHYIFQANDINFNDNKPVLMTEKDAVKCRTLAKTHYWLNYWMVPVSAQLSPVFDEHFLTLIRTKLIKKAL